MITTEYDMTDDELKAFCYLDHEPSMQTGNDKPMNFVVVENEYDFRSIDDLLKIPDYLVSTTTNKIFETMLKKNVYHSESSINMEELRSITIIMHQLNVLDLEKSLWNHYLESGTGILKTNESNLKIWPSKVTEKIQLDQRTTTLDNLNQIEVNDDQCFRFVNEYLRVLHEKQQRLQQQLIEERQTFYGYTNTIENFLRTFIEEHIHALRLQYDYELKLVEIDYRERILDHAFNQQNPLEQQIEFTKRLFNRKYDHEKAKQEDAWIKRHVTNNTYPKELHAVQLSLPSSILSLTDTDLQHQLSVHHRRIMQQYKREMIKICTDTIEAKLRECQKLFDDELSKMWQNQSILPTYERLNQIMIDLIESRLLIITEKVQCIYHYKHATGIDCY